MLFPKPGDMPVKLSGYINLLIDVNVSVLYVLALYSGSAQGISASDLKSAGIDFSFSVTLMDK